MSNLLQRWNEQAVRMGIMTDEKKYKNSKNNVPEKITYHSMK